MLICFMFYFAPCLLPFNFVFVLSAHLHVLDTWNYRISSNNVRGSYFKINLAEKAKSRGNSTGKITAIFNHIVIYKLSIYKNRLEQRT